MYIHLGQDTVISSKQIVGIFDIENTSISKHTKAFFADNEKNHRVINVSYEIPKSFIVCYDGKTTTIYISQISTATLKKRWENSL